MSDDRINSYVLCGCIGAILSTLISVSISHTNESICQKENNVADCEWVSVPVKSDVKTTKPSKVKQ